MSINPENKFEPELEKESEGKKEESAQAEKKDHETEQGNIANEYLREQSHYSRMSKVYQARLRDLDRLRAESHIPGASDNISRIEQELKQISGLMEGSGTYIEKLFNQLSEESKDKYLRGGEEMDRARREAERAYEEGKKE